MTLSFCVVSQLVIKVMDVPDNPHSRCVTHDVFHEVLVLEKTRGAPQVTRLMDYGVSDNRYFLVRFFLSPRPLCHHQQYTVNTSCNTLRPPDT